MDQAQLQARAISRAHSEHVHIFKTPRQGVYTTKSKSDPAERYNLVVMPDGSAACSCKGYYYRQSCKHAEALLNRIAREAARQ
jgi:hypothetical protein